MNRILKSQIIGTGSYLPSKKEGLPDFLSKGASRELVDKLGVYEHRVMGEDETVTDMEIEAAKIAVKRAGISPDDIDLIISGTAIPRQIGVPNSNALQFGIGAKNAAAFDIHLACASSIPSLVVASQFIELNQYKCILLTGSCHITRIADPTDPSSFIVLGDGAGAVIMAPSERESGILSFDLQTNGEYFNYCGSRVKKPKFQSPKNKDYFESDKEKLYFYIEDVENASSGVGRYLVSSVPNTVKKSIKKAGLSMEEVDFFITHQNINPLSGNWVKILGIPPEKTHLTYHKYGNMTSANIFLNLDEALQEGKIKDGNIVVFAGQGAGFSVGSIVMKW